MKSLPNPTNLTEKEYASILSSLITEETTKLVKELKSSNSAFTFRYFLSKLLYSSTCSFVTLSVYWYNSDFALIFTLTALILIMFSIRVEYSSEKILNIIIEKNIRLNTVRYEQAIKLFTSLLEKDENVGK